MKNRTNPPRVKQKSRRQERDLTVNKMREKEMGKGRDNNNRKKQQP